jgi:hypothetical protein
MTTQEAISAAWTYWRDCNYGTADAAGAKHWALLWRCLPSTIRWANTLTHAERIDASDRLPDALALELLR